MFGLLVKLAVAAIVGLGIFKFAPLSMPPNLDVNNVRESIKNVDISGLGRRLGQSLDSLVTHQAGSPVVLGIEITNESLKTIGDTLRGLPPDQLQIIKDYVCQPATSAGW
jgi:hypothetical protein